uniref:Uncharacterized protein n=1 Tax=Panagrolaimus davidi TaxID=227884 RepID=A0A914PNJ9_9BILA
MDIPNPLKQICNFMQENYFQSDQLRRAEVHMYYGNLEAAEKIYLDNDRRDLAIDMHRKMNNWPRILKLLQTSNASNSDALMIEAWKEVGDWFAERQKWAMAAKHYASGNHFDELLDCYIKMDDFGKMEQLMHQLPDNHAVLLVNF